MQDNYTIKKAEIQADELKKIVELLGREPNSTELPVFAAMWSESASNKSSKSLLKQLPQNGKNKVKNIGTAVDLIDVGNDLVCAIKLESHNHPTAMDPVQGAATGIGGVNRDIFTMGLRPIAQLNSLRFGNPKETATQWLMKGVIKGISSYSNALAVPVVGGEVFFDESYSRNPLVNTMAVGIAESKDVVPSRVDGIGNSVYIIGSLTGKDGLRGVLFASSGITEESPKEIAGIMVSDPFMGKLVLEASLELRDRGAIVAMQDIGGAGIIGAAAKMTHENDKGLLLDVHKVPVRETMTDSEILLSESQERMLIVVRKGMENIAEEILKKWELNYASIGEVIRENLLKISNKGKDVASFPLQVLIPEEKYLEPKKSTRPSYVSEQNSYNIKDIHEPDNLVDVANSMLQNPNLVSKQYIFEQFDYMVGTVNMSANAPSDAEIISIKETPKALGLSLRGNAYYVKANPNMGSMISVVSAIRDLACSGAEPLALTHCQNFGDPNNPETFWQFEEVIKGMAKACKHFKIPVTGGNVSFFNKSKVGDEFRSVLPTPVIGMLGLMDKRNQMTYAFREKGDMIYLLGRSKNDISSSEYLTNYLGIKNSPAPYFNLEEEAEIIEVVRELIINKDIRSAHNVREGGIFFSLLESAMVYDFGFDITSDAELRLDAFLFGEAQGRVIVSVAPSHEAVFVDFMAQKKIPISTLGHVTKSEVRVDDISYGFISDLKEMYNNTLERTINH